MTIKWKNSCLFVMNEVTLFVQSSNKTFKQNKKKHDHNKKTTSLTSKASGINISKRHVENTEL